MRGSNAKTKLASGLRQASSRGEALFAQVTSKLDATLEKDNRSKFYSEIDNLPQPVYSEDPLTAAEEFYEKWKAEGTDDDLIGVATLSLINESSYLLARQENDYEKEKHYLDKLRKEKSTLDHPYDYKQMRRCEIAYALAPRSLKPFMITRLRAWRQNLEADLGPLQERMAGPTQGTKKLFYN